MSETGTSIRVLPPQNRGDHPNTCTEIPHGILGFTSHIHEEGRCRMSTGIEVWVAGEESPCTISLNKEWEICVFDCCRPGEGPVKLCEDEPCKRPQCGHVHFSVPPG